MESLLNKMGFPCVYQGEKSKKWPEKVLWDPSLLSKKLRF